MRLRSRLLLFRPRRVLMRGLGMFVAVGGAPSNAQAHPGAVDVRVDAESVCIDQASFSRGLFARTRRPRGRGDSDELVLHVRVERRDDSTYRGIVRLAEGANSGGERVVTAASCGEIELAVLLVSALALSGDPEARAEPNRSRRADESNDGGETAPPRPSVRPAIDHSEPWALSVGLLAGLGLGGSDAWTSLDLAGEVASRRTGVSPAVRVSLGGGATRESFGDVHVDFRVGYVRVEPTFVRLARGPFESRFGLSLEGGAAFVEAGGAVRGAQAVRPWVRLGPHANARLRVLGTLAIELGGAVLFALQRDDFVVDGVPVLARTPLAAPVGRLGIFVEFQ